MKTLPITFIKFYKPTIVQKDDIKYIITKKIKERRKFFVEEVKVINEKTFVDNFELNDILRNNKCLPENILYNIILELLNKEVNISIKKEKNKKSELWNNIIFKFYQLLFDIFNEIEKEI